MKKIVVCRLMLILLATLVMVQTVANADVLILKSGKRIEAETVWTEGEVVKYSKLNSTVGLPKEQVERIIIEEKPSSVPVTQSAKNVSRPASAFNPIASIIPQSPGKPTGLDLSGVDAVFGVMIKVGVGLFVVSLGLTYLKLFLKRKILRIISQGIRKGKRTIRVPRGNSTDDSEEEADGPVSYERAAGLFTPAEKAFLSVLRKAIGDRYLIQGKVRLADIILPEASLSKTKAFGAFRRVSQKHVDFVICHKDDYTILGVVELDDKSHFRFDRMARDRFVDDALSAAGIPILHCPVKANYSLEALQEGLQNELGLVLDGEEGRGCDSNWRQSFVI